MKSLNEHVDEFVRLYKEDPMLAGKYAVDNIPRERWPEMRAEVRRQLGLKEEAA